MNFKERVLTKATLVAVGRTAIGSEFREFAPQFVAFGTSLGGILGIEAAVGNVISKIVTPLEEKPTGPQGGNFQVLIGGKRRLGRYYPASRRTLLAS